MNIHRAPSVWVLSGETATVDRLVRGMEDIPLDQRDLLEVVGENTRGKQAGDAATDNRGMAKGAARHGVAPLCILITDRALRHPAVLQG